MSDEIVKALFGQRATISYYDPVAEFNRAHVGICSTDELGHITWQPGHIERKIAEGAKYMYQLYERPKEPEIINGIPAWQWNRTDL